MGENKTTGNSGFNFGKVLNFAKVCLMDAGQFYHIYNRANGNENLFIEERNYDYFLEKLVKHVLPVVRLYSYNMMKNHFQMTIQVRSKIELQMLWMQQDGLPLPDEVLQIKTSKAFGNFFSSYTQSFNKAYNRKGSLFIPSMKITPVTDLDSFRELLLQIHKDPIHHRFVDNLEDWPHSSYKIFLENNETIVERDEVLKLFGGLEKFKEFHKR